MSILDEALGNEQSSILDEALIEHPRKSVTTVQPQEDTFFSNVGRDWDERLDTIQDPTYIKPGLRNVEQNALRLGGQVAGGIADVATQGLRSAYRSLVPQKAQDVISDVSTAIIENPIVSKAVEDVGMAWKGFSEAQPDLAKNVEAGLNIASVTPAKMFMPKGIRITKAVAKETGAVVNDTTNLFNRVLQPVTESYVDKEIKNVVTNNINKAIQSSTKNKNTIPLLNKYFDDAENGVKEIIANKSNIGFADDMGNIITGNLPQTRMQMAEAIHQTERKLFIEYDSMKKLAGEKGALLDLEPVAKELDSVIKDESLFRHPEGLKIQSYAKELQELLRANGGKMTPEAAQDWIASANSRLSNKNLTAIEFQKAGVDISLANMMRKELDKLIETEVGSGYQNLKKRYGAVKSLREGTNKAAFRSTSEKNLPNFFDITSGTALVHALVAGNPATLVGATFMEGLNRYRRYLTNPDTYVKRMFSQVDELMTKGGKFQPQSAAGKYIQGLGTEAPTNMPKSPYSFNPQPPRTPMIEYRENINPQMRGLNEQLPNSPSKAIGFDNRGVPVGDAYMPDVIDVPFSSSSSPLNSIEGRLMPRLGYSDFVVGEVNTLRRSKQRLPQDILERRHKYERY